MPQLDVINESKYSQFLDSNINQGGSQWQITPSKKIISATSAVDNQEYVAKVEMIKKNMHNMRSKALKYIAENDFIDIIEERRPSRFHLKCPICLEY